MFRVSRVWLVLRDINLCLGFNVVKVRLVLFVTLFHRRRKEADKPRRQVAASFGSKRLPPVTADIPYI